ncbi:MAG: transglutaminase-like domain-containing protein [Clostridia bacterium]|nr:transglutaminase-like domain-containing protein [Clostridia bacterium]
MGVVRRLFVCGICWMMLCCIAPTVSIGESQFLMPVLSRNQSFILETKGVTINYGNASQGYVMIRHEKTDLKLKVRISMGKNVYTYDLNSRNRYEVFPLQMGDGNYRIVVLKHEGNDAYKLITGKTIIVEMANPHIPFLYPNQYVNYTADSKAVAKAAELTAGLNTDREKFAAIYNFCSRRIVYNYQLALTPTKEHRVDVDKVLENRKGICLDYAVLMACMLRSQGIPTQVVIGYADDVYHAWNRVLLDGDWYRCDPTFSSAGGIAQVYREERRY